MKCWNYKGFLICLPSTSKVTMNPQLLPNLLDKGGCIIRPKTKKTPKPSDCIDTRATNNIDVALLSRQILSISTWKTILFIWGTNLQARLQPKAHQQNPFRDVLDRKLLGTRIGMLTDLTNGQGFWVWKSHKEWVNKLAYYGCRLGQNELWRILHNTLAPCPKT